MNHSAPQKLKTRLFITVGTFTTAVAAALIKQLGNENTENYLVSIAPTIYENLDTHIKSEANILNEFKEIYFYYDYCPPKSNFKDEKKHILSFDVKKFKNATNNIEFDEIYSVYIHGAANYLFNQYPNADLYFMEDGTATYLKMDNAEKINARAKKIYTLNYFNKIKPFVSLYQDVPTEQINKEYLKEIFQKLSEKIDFQLEQKERTVIFCAQNISINPIAMPIQAEFDLYAKNIMLLLSKGYFVYFKEHPKTPNMFFSKLKEKINHPNLQSLGQYNPLPVEVLTILLKPCAIVSMFSSALLTAPWLFEVPTFTFFADNEFKNHQIFGVAHLLLAHYIPPVESISQNEQDLKTTFELFNKKSLSIEKQPIYRIKLIDYFKMFISKREFNRIKRQMKKTHKFLLQYANISAEVIYLFENQTYLDFLLFYGNNFQQRYTKYLTSLKNSKLTYTTVLKFIKDGFGVIFKLIL